MRSPDRERRWKAPPSAWRITLPLAVVMGLLPILARTNAAWAQTPGPLAEWQYSAGVGLRPLFQDPLPTWDVSLGVATSAQPRYPGSSQYHLEPGLTFDARYKDIAFSHRMPGLKAPGWA